MASHPLPSVNVETRKGPLPSTPTVDVLSKHQRVNLYYCVLDPDGVLKDTRFILVQAEYPYVQFVVAAHVISTERFVVGVTNGQERDRSRVSDGKVERTLRALLLLSYVLCDAWCVLFFHPLSGVLCLSFYRPRGSRDYRWEKEEKSEAKKVLRRCRIFLFL